MNTNQDTALTNQDEVIEAEFKDMYPYEDMSNWDMNLFKSGYLSASKASESEINSLKEQVKELEDIRINQLAGISTASFGYFKNGDDIHPDFDTTALRDVTSLYEKYECLYKERIELQAHVNQLREALEAAMNDDAGWYDMAKQAEINIKVIDSTPAKSLAEHDNEVID